MSLLSFTYLYPVEFESYNVECTSVLSAAELSSINKPYHFKLFILLCTLIQSLQIPLRNDYLPCFVEYSLFEEEI
jgi:hypothetical protein